MLVLGLGVGYQILVLGSQFLGVGSQVLVNITAPYMFKLFVKATKFGVTINQAWGMGRLHTARPRRDHKPHNANAHCQLEHSSRNDRHETILTYIDNQHRQPSKGRPLETSLTCSGLQKMG